MTRFHRFVRLFSAFFLIGAPVYVSADAIFYDDFEDGSATDGDPVTWEPRVYTNGLYEVINGDYVLTPNAAPQPLVAVVSGVTAQDVSLRTQIRVNGAAFGIGLFARFLEGSHTYQGGIDTSGDVYIGWNSADTRYHNLADVFTDLRPNQEEISLQFDVIGNVLRMYAWRSHESRPALPTVEVVDDQFPDAANMGILNHLSGLGFTSYRFIYAATASIPAPECDFDSNALCRVADLNALLSVGPVVAGVPVVPGGNDLFDLTGNGVIDNEDVDAWLALAATENGLSSPYKRGDANLDGVVDGSDFGLWNGHKFTSTLLWDQGNFNGDAVTDGGDFGIWNMNKFTSSDGIAVVPEPATGCLCLMLGLWCASSLVRQRAFSPFGT